MAVGLTVGLLAALVAAAGWRLGATNRGLVCLAIAAVMGIVGRIAGVEEYVLLAVAMGVLLAAGPIVLWHRAERAVGTIHIELRPSSHEIAVGGTATLLVTVSNESQLTSAPMRIESPDDAWHLSRPGLRPRGADTQEDEPTTVVRARRTRGWRRRVARGTRVPALGPSDQAELTFSIPSGRRGVLTVPNLKIWCLDPFELFAYEMVVTTETGIVVVPRSTPPTAVVGGVLQPAGRIEWSPPASGEASGGQGFDLSGLRPYLPGDRLRLLHWPTLARTGELLVRDFEGSGTDAVTLIMDDRAGMVDEQSFESIVSATAGIGAEAARLGLGLELRTPGGVNIDLQAGPHLTKSLLRLLATLDPVAARSARSRDENGSGQAAFALGKMEDGYAVTDKNRIVVSSAAAVETLPELLRRSSTVVVI